jgi:hypothetical protein
MPSVLLPLDDASLWQCSRVKPVTRWIVVGASGRNAEFAISKRVAGALAFMQSAFFQSVWELTSLASGRRVSLARWRRSVTSTWFCASSKGRPPSWPGAFPISVARFLGFLASSMVASDSPTLAIPMARVQKHISLDFDG